MIRYFISQEKPLQKDPLFVHTLFQQILNTQYALAAVQSAGNSKKIVPGIKKLTIREEGEMGGVAGKR